MNTLKHVSGFTTPVLICIYFGFWPAIEKKVFFFKIEETFFEN